MKNEIIIKGSFGAHTIRKEISNVLTEDEMTRAIAPFSKENILSVKIISSDEVFILEAGAFQGCRNLEKINLSKVEVLEVSDGMLKGCMQLRKVIYPRGW